MALALGFALALAFAAAAQRGEDWQRPCLGLCDRVAATTTQRPSCPHLQGVPAAGSATATAAAGEA